MVFLNYARNNVYWTVKNNAQKVWYKDLVTEKLFGYRVYTIDTV